MTSWSPLMADASLKYKCTLSRESTLQWEIYICWVMSDLVGSFLSAPTRVQWEGMQKQSNTISSKIEFFHRSNRAGKKQTACARKFIGGKWRGIVFLEGHLCRCGFLRIETGRRRKNPRCHCGCYHMGPNPAGDVDLEPVAHINTLPIAFHLSLMIDE